MKQNSEHGQLLSAITDYWSNRAQGYSDVNVEELQSLKRQQWQEAILAQAPSDGRQLNVLDIGTGPGFFAIIMAQAGHRVTAVDATEKMLMQARQNAANYDVAIEFVQSDVHTLPFEDEQFDLIVTRNVTWNLANPAQAYDEWHRVLKKGGRLINFDANWYLYLFDNKLREQFEQDRAATQRLNIPDHYADTDTAAMETIARRLPLSRERRPQWDLNTLLQIGYRRLLVDTKIGETLWDEAEKINYRSTPMFMVIAQK